METTANVIDNEANLVPDRLPKCNKKKKRKALKNKLKKSKVYNNYQSHFKTESSLIEAARTATDAERLNWALEQLRFRPNQDHVEMVVSKAKRKSVDPELMVGLVTAESGFRANVVHHNGGSNDYGLFQLNNLWHNQHKGNVSAHIDAGIDHFKWCLKTEKNNVNRALSRYNTGGGDSAAGRQYAAYVMRTKDQILNKAKNYVPPELTASETHRRNKIERLTR